MALSTETQVRPGNGNEPRRGDTGGDASLKIFEKDWRTPACAGCGTLSIPSGRSGGRNCEKRFKKIYVQSRNVYENKQISDTMPGKNSDIYVLDSDICVK